MRRAISSPPEVMLIGRDSLALLKRVSKNMENSGALGNAFWPGASLEAKIKSREQSVKLHFSQVSRDDNKPCL